MRDFLRVDDLSGDEIVRILDRADELRGLWNENRMPRPLEGMRVALCMDYEAKDRLLHAQNAVMEFVAEGASA